MSELQESDATRLVTREMIESGARALAPHVAGADPLDRWTLDAARDVLLAALERRQW